MLVAAYGVGPESVLMHNNARAHIACITVLALEWSEVSPDLNPIEHVWDRFNRSFHRRPVPPQTLQDLE